MKYKKGQKVLCRVLVDWHEAVVVEDNDGEGRFDIQVEYEPGKFEIIDFPQKDVQEIALDTEERIVIEKSLDINKVIYFSAVHYKNGEAINIANDDTFSKVFRKIKKASGFPDIDHGQTVTITSTNK